MDISGRLRAVRLDSRKTQKEFAESILVSDNAVSMMERGVMAVSPRTLAIVCEKYNVSKEWLETGEGDMYNLPLDEEAAMFARLSLRSNASAAALKAVIKFYLTLGDDGIEVLDKLIQDAIKKDPE